MDTVTERTVKYATCVPDLPAAWTFVMSHIQEVGPDPSIVISPIWSYGDDNFNHRTFEVAVSGMVEQPKEEA